jgi:DNA-binding NarL/FixJ family response regulator
MNRFRVLLLGDKERLPEDLPALLYRDSGKELVAEPVEIVSDALARLGERGYDAAVCWAEGSDELAGVIRLRHANPDLPILVLTSQEDRGFEGLSQQAGATRTARVDRDPTVSSECIRRTIESGALRREWMARGGQARSRAPEGRAKDAKSRRLPGPAPDLAQKRPTIRAPILVEDRPEQALLLVRAFGALGIPVPVPVFPSGEAAVRFLSDESPSPALDPVQPFSYALIDIDLPGMSGLDLLEWMGRSRRLRGVPAVMLSHSTDPEHVHRAFRLGAKSYLIKPAGFEALVRLVEGVHRFWSSSDARAD